MKRLLVLRALGLGDLLTSVPALRALAIAFPDHRLILAAPRSLAPLARHAGVDEVLDCAPLGALSPDAHRADVAVNLHGRGPESHRALGATGPKRVLAFHNPLIPWTVGSPEWRDEEHEVTRWCRLLEGYGIPADPSRLDLDPPLRACPRGSAGATLVHPGAASPARRWPADRWARVAAHEARSRPVFVTGGPKEVDLARRVAEQAGLPAGRVLAGRTDLLDLMAIVSSAGRVVCGDTGVAHLATAVGTSSVVLFGPTSPAQWGPPPERPQHIALWHGLTGDPHGDRTDPGLASIEVGEVLAALARLEPRPEEVAS